MVSKILLCAAYISKALHFLIATMEVKFELQRQQEKTFLNFDSGEDS